MHSVTNILKDGSIWDITQLVQSIRWSHDIRSAARRLELSIAYGDDDYQPKYLPPLGSLLIIAGDAGEVLRAVVFNNQRTNPGGLEVTAYDHGIYLTKSKATYVFKNTTAAGIIKKVCADAGVGIGSLPALAVPLTRVYRSMTLWDIIVAALTETSKRTGKKYQVRFIAGKLNVIDKSTQTVSWRFATGENLISGSYTESLEEMKNKIVVYGDKDQVVATVSDAALVKEYGTLQEELREGNKAKAGETAQIAKNMLKQLGKVGKTAKISVLGVDSISAGMAVQVEEPVTGLTLGTFYVEADSHTVQEGEHVMDLDIIWTDEVATAEVSE